MYTSLTGMLIAARAIAACTVAMGCVIVPGLPSAPPVAETKIALLISPSIPSQLESTNMRSGTSVPPPPRHSQPLLIASRAALRSPFESTAPIWQVHAHAPIAHAASALARVGHAMLQPPQCIGLVIRSNIGAELHAYEDPVGVHVSVVQAFMSSQDGGALRIQRRRAASHDQVPMHALLLSRWHVESPTSQGTSARQPLPSMQNCPPGQRISLGTCVHRPAIASQRSSVHATLSSQSIAPPTITQRPPVQRRALVQRSAATQSSLVRHAVASVSTTSAVPPSGATPVSGAASVTSVRASVRTPLSRRIVGSSPCAQESATGASITWSQCRRSIVRVIVAPNLHDLRVVARVR